MILHKSLYLDFYEVFFVFFSLIISTIKLLIFIFIIGSQFIIIAFNIKMNSTCDDKLCIVKISLHKLFGIVDPDYITRDNVFAVSDPSNINVKLDKRISALWIIGFIIPFQNNAWHIYFRCLFAYRVKISLLFNQKQTSIIKYITSIHLT